MYYEINVSKDGKHYFATAKRSLSTEEATTKMVVDFKERFPSTEGFKILVDYNPEQGSFIDVTDAKSDKEIRTLVSSLSN